MFEIDLPAARVVFTTRQGGHSEGPFASLNIGHATKDDPEVVAKNLRKLSDELGHDELQLLRQVHSDMIVEFGPEASPRIPHGDGATTEHRLSPILITGADCPSVFIGSSDRLTALHCGWRPVAAGIVEAGCKPFAGSAFDAVIGPGICAEHFEVGPEVVMAMGSDGEQFVQGRQLDLIGIIRHRLRRAGARSVKHVERCTYCEPELFFSHRRDGELTGRQAGVAWRI